MKHTKKILLIILFLLHGCASYERFRYITEEFEIPSLIFKVEYSQAWIAVKQIMNDYDIADSNQEAGMIKTRWMDNTLELNFADSFAKSDSVKAAKFKLIVNVVKGFRGSREVSKVTVYKRQLVEEDFLQGWKEIPSDGIFEKTILYRIGMVITRDVKLKKIEEAKAREAEAEMDL